MSKRALWLLLIFACASSKAASFDCAKATQLVESFICADSELSALDDSLANAYRDALANVSNADSLRVAQRRWLKSRNACKNKACLVQKYSARISALGVYAAPASRALALPAKVGDCADSVISGKATRFEGATPGEVGGEVVIQLENGVALYIVDVAMQPPPENADRYMHSTSDFAVGDRVRLCLAALPGDCPPGDDRGKRYSVTNNKNRLSFVGVDAWHLCGGP